MWLSLWKKRIRDEFGGRLGWSQERIDALTMQDVTEYFAFINATEKARV